MKYIYTFAVCCLAMIAMSLNLYLWESEINDIKAHEAWLLRWNSSMRDGIESAGSWEAWNKSRFSDVLVPADHNRAYQVSIIREAMMNVMTNSEVIAAWKSEPKNENPNIITPIRPYMPIQPSVVITNLPPIGYTTNLLWNGPHIKIIDN